MKKKQCRIKNGKERDMEVNKFSKPLKLEV